MTVYSEYNSALDSFETLALYKFGTYLLTYNRVLTRHSVLYRKTIINSEFLSDQSPLIRAATVKL